MGASAVILSGVETSAPRYEGVEEAVAGDPRTDIRIFGKPSARVNRRMGVVVGYEPHGSSLEALRERGLRRRRKSESHRITTTPASRPRATRENRGPFSRNRTIKPIHEKVRNYFDRKGDDESRAVCRRDPRNRGQLRRTGRTQLLRRADLPPCDSRLRDPGRLPQGRRHGGPGYTIKCETSAPRQRHDRGVLSMAMPGATRAVRSSSSATTARIRSISTAVTPASGRWSKGWT